LARIFAFKALIAAAIVAVCGLVWCVVVSPTERASGKDGKDVSGPPCNAPCNVRQDNVHINIEKLQLHLQFNASNIFPGSICFSLVASCRPRLPFKELLTMSGFAVLQIEPSSHTGNGALPPATMAQANNSI
jgi:hypothetical protein